MREAPKVYELGALEDLINANKAELTILKRDRSILLHVRFPDENKFNSLIKRQQQNINDFYMAIETELLESTKYTAQERNAIRRRIVELREKELHQLTEKAERLLVDLRKLRADQIAVKRLSGQTAEQMVASVYAPELKMTYSSHEIWSAAIDILDKLGIKLEKEKFVAKLPGIENHEAYLESLNFFTGSFSEQIDRQEINYHFLNLQKLLREQQRVKANVTEFGDEILAERAVREATEKVSEEELRKLIFDILEAGGVFKGKVDYSKDKDYLESLSDILKKDKSWIKIHDFLKVYKPITVVAGSKTGDFIVLGRFKTAMRMRNFHFAIPFDLLPKKEQQEIVETQRSEFMDKVADNNLKTIRSLADYFKNILGYETEEMKMLFGDYEASYLQYVEDTSSPDHDEQTAREDFDIAGEKLRKYVSTVMEHRLDELVAGRSIENLTNEEKMAIYQGMPNIVGIAALSLVNQDLFDIAPLVAAESSAAEQKLTNFDNMWIDSLNFVAGVTPREKESDVGFAAMLLALIKSGREIEAKEALNEK